MQLGRLAFCRGRLDLAFDHDAATDRQLLDLVGIVRQLARRDDLQIAKATAVVELNEAEARLGIATGTNPAAHLDRLANGRFLTGFTNQDPVVALHRLLSS